MIEVSQENIDLYAARIKNFELEAGESFTDYFMDGEVFAGSWGFWLIGKGYTERGNAIINAYNKANKKHWSDQELCFAVNASPLRWDMDSKEFYPWQLDRDINLDLAINADYKLWAEFLISSDRYYEPFLKYLENFEAGGEY